MFNILKLTNTFINTMNLFKEKFKSDLNSYIRKMLDEENRSFSQHQNYLHEARYLKDFFSTLINELNFTLEDILDGATTKQIANVLYSGYHTRYSNRNEFQEIFKPILSSRIEFFKECLDLCLNEHENIYDVDGIGKAKNTEEFKNLLQIGINSGFFEKIPAESLITLNDDYSQILQDYQILKLNFNENHLIELMLHHFTSRKQRNDTLQPLQDYILTFPNESFSIFSDFDSSLKWIQKNISSKIEETNTQLHSSINKHEADAGAITLGFGSVLFSNSTKNSFESQKKSFHQWIKNNGFLKSSFENQNYNYLNSNGFNNYELLYDFLMNLPKNKQKELFQLPHYISDYDYNNASQYSNKLGALLKQITSNELSFDKLIPLLELIYDKKKQIVEDAKLEHTPHNDSQAFLSSSLHKIINFYLFRYKSIETMEQENPEKFKETTKKLFQFYLNQYDIFFDFITENNLSIDDSIKQIQENIAYFGNLNFKISDTLFEPLKEKLLSYQKDFYKKTSNNTIQSKTASAVSHLLAQVSDNFGSDYLNYELIIKSEREFTTSSYHSGKTKHTTVRDYPFVFSFIEKIKTQDSFNSLFSKNNIPELLNIKYKRNTPISFILESCATNKDEDRAKMLIQALLQSPKDFNSLIIKDKKNQEYIQKIGSDLVNQTIKAFELNFQLSKKIKTKNSEDSPKLNNKVKI